MNWRDIAELPTAGSGHWLKSWITNSKLKIFDNPNIVSADGDKFPNISNQSESRKYWALKEHGSYSLE